MPLSASVLSLITKSLTNCIDNTFSYYLHLPLQTLRCAHVLPEIFLQSQLLLLTLSLTLLLMLNTCLHITHCHCPYFTLCHSICHSSACHSICHHSNCYSLRFRLILHPHCHSSVITPHCHSAFHSICCLILSTHMLILGERLVNTLL